jgi:hypothetical protein
VGRITTAPGPQNMVAMFRRINKQIATLFAWQALLNSGQSVSAPGPFTTTSSTYVSLGVTASVNVGIGTQVRVTVQAYCNPTANPLGVSVELGVSVNGGTPFRIAGMSDDVNNGNESTVVGIALVGSGINQATANTFELCGLVSAGNSVTFTDMVIIAEPI